MCESYVIDGKYIETIGELADLLPGGINHVPIEPFYRTFVPRRDDCLCPVDCELAAKLLGMVAVRNQDFDWVFTKSVATQPVAGIDQ